MKVKMLNSLKFIIFIFLFSACAKSPVFAQNDGNKKAKDLYQKADEDFVFGRVNEALIGFQNAVAADPNYLNAHLKLVELYQNYYQEYDKAIVHYDKILELDKEIDYAYFGKAQCLFYLDEFDEALVSASIYAQKEGLTKVTQFQND